MKSRPGPKPKTPESYIEVWIKGLDNGHRNARTIKGYRSDINYLTKFLKENGRNYLPEKINREDVKWLLDYWADNQYAVSTRKDYFSSLKQYIEYFGNDTIRLMDISWPHDNRPHVDWLTPEQAQRLLDMDMNPVQELVIHCELCLGMRRIEVLRLTIESFKGGYVNILGKGSQGGKPRLMSCHPDTARVLAKYMKYRNDLIAIARSTSRKKELEIPDRLLVYLKGTRILSYSEKGTGIDTLLKPLAEELGTDFSNHTLRRTFGRMMYYGGTKLVTLAAMLGHESVAMTLKYIGIELDEMGHAMQNSPLMRRKDHE